MNIDGNTENDDLDGLDTNANRHEGQSNQELALIVNTALIESLQKAEKQKKLVKQFSPKELVNMKKAYDATSAFTTIMSDTLDKSIPHKDFEEMNQDMLRWVNLTIEENPTGDGNKNSSDNSSSEDKTPPPKKKWKSSFESVLKTCGEESDDDNDDIVGPRGTPTTCHNQHGTLRSNSFVQIWADCKQIFVLIPMWFLCVLDFWGRGHCARVIYPT